MMSSPAKHPSLPLFIALLAAIVLPSFHAKAQFGIDIEAAPFRYSKAVADNRVSRLIEQLESKSVRLEYTKANGYLPSILQALEIPESSQTLVFSKTSLQVRYISRRNPRAIYFNDDTYVGWVRGSSLMEISTADPVLGTAFYTVDMMPWRAKVKQAYYDCLACHATSMTKGVPGHTVRSVHPEVDGSVATQRDSFITDHTSPISQRWGGWYVTGRHGDMRHMGNSFLRSGQLDTVKNGNKLSLWDEFDTQDYLTPYSDIVALMVLEHQTQMHNAIVLADFKVRKHFADTASETSPVDASERAAEIKLFAKEVVDCILFCNEAQLTSPVAGSVLFVDDFVKRGPKDSQGRSIRDFDLKTRLFKYPCSYIIYTEAFDTLQTPLKNEVIRQLIAVLSGEEQAEEYSHLDQKTREETLAILKETRPEWFLSGQAE